MSDNTDPPTGEPQDWAYGETIPDVPEPPPELLPAKDDPALRERQTSALQSTDPQANRALEVNQALVPAYQRAGTLVLSKEEQEILMEPFADEKIAIRPDGPGLIYVPHILVSDRLNRALGIGQWSCVKRKDWIANNIIYAEWVFIVRGVFVYETVTEREYFPNNARKSYNDALESTRGDALRRMAGKQFSCGSQCWDPDYAAHWQAKYAEQVWQDVWNPKTRRKEPKQIWRKKGQAAPEAPSASPPAKSPPQAPPEPKSKASGKSDAERLEAWKAELRPHEPYASFWAIDNGKLLPNETVEDLTVMSIPKTKGDLKAIMADIEARKAGSAQPQPPPKQQDIEDIWLRPPGEEPIHWRDAIVPFGKNAGKAFGDLEKGDLWWWCVKWEPRPWTDKQGKERPPSAKDNALRAMLDDVQKLYTFKDNE